VVLCALVITFLAGFDKKRVLSGLPFLPINFYNTLMFVIACHFCADMNYREN
jgi:hypothetical protein